MMRVDIVFRTLLVVFLLLKPSFTQAEEGLQSFLEQTETAVKEEDFQQADALSSRALLLTQDLSDK